MLVRVMASRLAEARTARRWLLVPAVLCLPAASAFAVTEAELLGPDLAVHGVRITTLQNQILSYFDEHRNLQNTPTRRLVQLRVIDGQSAVDSPIYPCVNLTDGQRYTGQWIGAAPDGSSLRWHNDLVGVMSIPLDEIRSVVWQHAGSASSSNTDTATDTIVLSNGDTMTGFVSALSDQGVRLIPDQAANEVTIPFSRIARLSMANPNRDAVGSPYWLTLIDGTRTRADELSIIDDQASWLTTPPGGSPTEIQTPVTDLVRIDFGAGGWRLIELNELPMQTVSDQSVFGMAMPVRVQDGSIRAHAPAEIVFDLPDGAIRFAAVAELDTTDMPVPRRDWADFDIVVYGGDEAVGRGHVTGNQPISTLNMPISASTLKIRLEPGVNGPILDRLRLRNPVILTRQTPTGDARDTDH